MKAQVLIPGIIVLILCSCSSRKLVSQNTFDDDVYFAPKASNGTSTNGQATGVSSVAANSYTTPSPSDNSGMSDYERYRMALESGMSAEEATAYVRGAHVEYFDAPEGDNRAQYAYVETAQSNDGQGNTVIINNYYEDSYSARINRFSGPYLGFSYFDPWYFGPSYRFGYSSYYGWNMSFGWGSPYYSPWYSPYYYGWYDPWYYRPYYHPYYSGYYRYNDHYHTSYRTRVSGPVQRRSGSALYSSTRYGGGVKSSVSPTVTSSRSSAVGESYRTTTPASYTRSASQGSSSSSRATTTSATPSRSSNTGSTSSSTTAPSRSTTTTSSNNYGTPRTTQSSSSTSTTGSSSGRTSSSYTAPSNSTRSSSSTTTSPSSTRSSSSSSSSYSAPSSSRSSSSSSYSSPSSSSSSRSSSSGSGSSSSSSSSRSSGSSSSSGGRR